MKKPVFSLFALSVTLLFSQLASAGSIYDFGKIDWNRDAGKSDGIPMMCDDAAYRAVSIRVPGTLNRDFGVKLDGSDCRVRSAKFDSATGDTRVVIDNSDNCTVTIEELEQGHARGTYELDLSDAC
jgi:hypothetical protein